MTARVYSETEKLAFDGPTIDLKARDNSLSARGRLKGMVAVSAPIIIAGAATFNALAPDHTETRHGPSTMIGNVSAPASTIAVGDEFAQAGAFSSQDAATSAAERVSTAYDINGDGLKFNVIYAPDGTNAPYKVAFNTSNAERTCEAVRIALRDAGDGLGACLPVTQYPQGSYIIEPNS